MSDIDYLRGVVEPLVSEPTGLIINRQVDEQGVLLSLTVAKSDMPRIIGKEGITAKAIRTLLYRFGMNNNARLSLKILEPAQ